MKSKHEALKELQEETVEKERIILAIYGSIGALSLTCLLRLMSIIDDGSIVVILSSSCFAISTIVFTALVLSKYHVLHKARDIHIGHVIASEDLGGQVGLLGADAFILGFLLMLIYISVITFVIGILALVFCHIKFKKFRKDISDFMGAREALDKSKEEK